MTPRRIAFTSCALLALLVTACGSPGFGHRRARMGGRMGWFQGGGGGRGGPGGRGMMAMQDPIARLLDHQADLKLTTAQVNNLISIDDKLQADNSPMRQKLAGWRGSMGQNRNGNRRKPDSAQMAMHRTMRDCHDRVPLDSREQLARNERRLCTADSGPTRDGGPTPVTRSHGRRPWRRRLHVTWRNGTGRRPAGCWRRPAWNAWRIQPTRYDDARRSRSAHQRRITFTVRCPAFGRPPGIITNPSFTL